MRYRPCITAAALLGFGTLFGIHYARAAELKLLSAAAMKSAFVELLPQFEQATGHRVIVEYGTTAGFRPRIEGNEPFDVAVIVQTATEELVRSGRLLQDPRPVIGITVASLVYKSGTPKPDIATPEAFKTTLLGAAKISLSDPSLGGTSSIYFINVVKRLGLDNAINEKFIITKSGAGATPVVEGSAQYGVALTSEIAGVAGISGVPIFPSDPASTTTLAASISSVSIQPEAARAFIAFLVSPEAIAVRRAKGLVPD